MSNIFERNLTLKIVSIIVSIVVWASVQSQEDIEHSKKISDIPIEFLNEAYLKEQNLTLISDTNPTITVTVRGNIRTLGKVDNKMLRATVDLTQIESSGRQKVKADIHGIPSGVRLEQVPEVNLVVETIVTKEIPIHIALAGYDSKENKGYEIYSTEIIPETVTLTGAESLVNSVVEGRVGLDISNMVTTIERSLPIQLLNEKGRVVPISKHMKIDSQNANVKVTIYPKKTVHVTANIVGTPAEGFEVYQVEVVPSEIVIMGEPEALEEIESIGTEMLDINGASADVHKKLRLQQYEGIFISSGQPKQFDVVARLHEINLTKQFPVENVILNNIPYQRRPELSTRQVSVTLSGPYSVINNIQSGDIKAYLDLKGLSVGESQVRVDVEIPQGAEIVSIEPAEITVKIQ